MRARVLLPLLLLLCAVLAPSSAVAEPVPPVSPLAVSPVAVSPVAVSPVALWSAPLHGDLAVTRPFDPPPSQFAAGHRGVDLGGTPWSPVLAAGDGVVVFAGMVAGRPVISIDHADGLRTTYEPVDPSVGAGQRVTRGSPIGTLLGGHAGCPREACLHWGLRRGESYLDPLALLRPPRIRLLPWADR